MAAEIDKRAKEAMLFCPLCCRSALLLGGKYEQ